MNQNLAGSPVHIETNGFLLRSLTPADASPSFLKWINSSEMIQGLNLPPLNFTEEQLPKFIASFDNRHNYFIGIFDLKTQLLVGFYTLDINTTHQVGNITCGIGVNDYEGKGVLWATIDALLDHFFLYRDTYKIVARVLSNNRRMLFNFIGNTRFIFEAKLQKECVLQTGKRVDVMLFASFKDQKVENKKT